MKTVRSRPAIAHAIKWTGKNLEEVEDFACRDGRDLRRVEDEIYIEDQAGTVKADKGDWLVREMVDGTICALSPEHFDGLFEVVEE